MILVPHYVAASPLGGVGLFTHAAIPAGDVVYRYDARMVVLFSEGEIAGFPPSMQAAMHRYAFRGCGSERLGNAVYYCIDDSRFLNHDDAPNLVWDGGTHVYTAVRDIAANSELTCDYGDFTRSGDGYTDFR